MDVLTWEIERLRDEKANLLEACKGLYWAVNAVRHDLGTNYPALSEAWVLAGAAIKVAERKAT